MKWHINDIRYIRKDLQCRGFAEGELLNELVDHVCCEMEPELQKGVPFKNAYEKVAASLSSRQIRQLQIDSYKASYSNHYNMLSNIFKIMWRQAVKFKMYTIINLAGLAVGLTAFTVIALFMKHELSYDTQFGKASSIYRVTMSSTVGGNANHIPTTYPTIAPELKMRYVEVENYTRIVNYKYTRLRPTFRSGDHVFYEDNVIFVDSTFFKIFDFPFLEGNPSKALSVPNSVVLTKKMAEKYFGDKKALGRSIRFNDNEMIVTGVLRAIPSNTHLQFDFVIPMSGIQYSGAFGNSEILDSWQVDWFWNYLYIPNSSALDKIQSAVSALVKEKNSEVIEEHNAKFYLQALTDVHLRSDFDYNTDLSANGDRSNLFILGSIALLVLLISSINFINISMATATRRYKEIGISKVLGAMKFQLRTQYILEAVIMCLVAFLLALVATTLTLPLFSQLEGVSMTLSFRQDYILLCAILLFVLVLGTLSGAYPAFFMASFEPHRVLKGVWKPGVGGASFRKILTGIQIAISVFLVIGTIVVSEQLSYVNQKNLGFDKDHIIILPIRGTQVSRKYVEFKNELLKESAIQSMTSVSEPIGREVQFMNFKVEDKDEVQLIKILNVTHDFAKTMNVELVAGRDFSPEISSDSMSGFLVNEAAVRAFAWDDPIGKGIQHTWRAGIDGRVVGVVKDFNFEPLQKQIDPIVIWFGRPFWYAAVRIESGRSEQALASLEKAWKQFEPEKPFSFQFLDATIQQVYEKEERMSQLFFVFAILSIATAMSGLYGLVSFILDQRLTEFGVRKVMGASARNIVMMISWDYALLVIISFAAALPITYWTMDRWLEGFAFRINWSAWYYLIGLFIAFGVVLSTVIAKAWSASSVNPATVLRGE